MMPHSREAVGLRYANLIYNSALPFTGRPMLDRITHDPNLLAGRATLRGLRISVAHVVNLVANGMTTAQIIADLPDLEEEDIRQALAYAGVIAEDQIHPIPVGK
jgi:uncharacterized protein (DUF433 family)